MIRAWIERVCLLCMLLLLTFGKVTAQKMKVESFVELSQAEDPDAKDPTFRRADTQASRSGKYCAIIKLITTVQDKNFSFDLGVDYVPEGVVYRDNGEVWIYVPSGTNKIKISHNRYGQLDTRDGYYNFKEAGIAKCKEATVYRLRLHTDFNPDEDIIKDANKLATVRFKVHPVDATIILRKIPEPTDSSGILEKQMPLGIYHYRVSHPDYHYLDGTFELSEENETKPLELRLSQAFGWLALDSDFKPSGYTFTVDGQITTDSSLKRLPLRSGAHTVEVQHPHYYPQTIQFMIQDSAVYDLSPSLKPRLGRLLVTTDQPGAVVSVDGEKIGITPLEESYEMIIGTHNVEVSCANYRTEKRSVTIVEGQTTNLPITLEDVAHYTFSSTPSMSKLYINGEYVDSTPCVCELSSGYYQVRIEHKKYRTIDRRMYLDSSNPELSFHMSRQYQQKYQMYFQPTFQYGVQMGVGATAGLYLANVNVEAIYLVGRKSSPIYWSNIEELHQPPIEETFNPTTVAFNVGYGFVIGTCFRITPQVGVDLIDLAGSQGNRCGTYSASVGTRIEYVAANHFGICLVPDYAFPVYKSDNFVRISDILTELKGYATGRFNLKIGFYFYL